MRRLGEYSPSIDLPRFEAHEGFFVNDVPAWVREHCGVALSPERTAFFGVSPVVPASTATPSGARSSR